jgi:hypothetical protein
VEQEVHDLGDGRHGATQIKAGGPVERIAPGRRDERNEQLIRRHRQPSQAGQVAGVQDIDGQGQSRQIFPGESEDSRIRFEPDAPRARQVAQQPIQRVARAGEQIHDECPGHGRHACGNPCHILADRVCQCVTRTFDRSPSQKPDAPPIPVGGP